MKKVIVVGSINMDLVVSVDDFPKPGETILGKGNYWIPGGKGANQAVTISHLKGNVSMFGKIGDDNLGQKSINNLRKENVDISKIKCIQDCDTGLAIINVNAEGENNIVVLSGANKVWPETDEEIKAALKGYDLVVLQMEIPIMVIEKVLKLAKEMDIFTVLNCAPATIDILPFLQNIDLLLVNEIELSILSGVEIRKYQDILDGVERLASYCNSIIVTLGEEGCLIKSYGKIKKIPAYQVKAIDTTAAGDAFVGGIVTKLSEGFDLFTAGEFATAVSALTVTKMGAQSSIPYRDEVNCYLKDNSIKS